MRYFLNKSLIITKKLNFSMQTFVQRLPFQPLTHTLTPTHPPPTHTHKQGHIHTLSLVSWLLMKKVLMLLPRPHPFNTTEHFFARALKQTMKEKILFQPSFQINPKAIRRSRKN